MTTDVSRSGESTPSAPISVGNRRVFLTRAGATALGMTLFGDLPTAAASGTLTPGDEALLRFPAELETLEADFWLQYNELGGVQDHEAPGGSGNKAYTNALTVLDADMPRPPMACSAASRQPSSPS